MDLKNGVMPVRHDGDGLESVRWVMLDVTKPWIAPGGIVRPLPCPSVSADSTACRKREIPLGVTHRLRLPQTGESEFHVHDFRRGNEKGQTGLWTRGACPAKGRRPCSRSWLPGFSPPQPLGEVVEVIRGSHLSGLMGLTTHLISTRRGRVAMKPLSSLLSRIREDF